MALFPDDCPQLVPSAYGSGGANTSPNGTATLRESADVPASVAAGVGTIIEVSARGFGGTPANPARLTLRANDVVLCQGFMPGPTNNETLVWRGVVTLADYLQGASLVGDIDSPANGGVVDLGSAVTFSVEVDLGADAIRGVYEPIVVVYPKNLL